MGTLKVESLNVKTLVVGGKEFRPLTSSEMYSDNFIADEKYIITQEMLTNGTYTITRTIEENNIFRHSIKTTNSLIEYSVQKTGVRTFIYFGETEPLGDNSIIIINGTPLKVSTVVVNDGYFTYTLESDFDEVYTSFCPIKEIIVNDEQISMAYVTSDDTNIYVNYSMTYCDLREIDIIVDSSINTVEIDLFTSLGDDALTTITWADIIGNDDIDVDSALLISNQYIELNGQTFTLDSGSKWVIN